MATAGVRGRIDMSHGFMKSIIKNQFDRDNYDKEVRLEKSKQKSPKNDIPTSRVKKPDRQVYHPPTSHKSDFVDMKSETKITDKQTRRKRPLFKVEYEDEKGFIHELPIFKSDDLQKVSRRFGSSLKFSHAMIKALQIRLEEEYKKHNT